MDVYGLQGFVARPATESDIQVMADLVAAYERAAFGSSDYTIEDLRDEWGHPGFSLEDDALVVAAPDGAIAGCAAVSDRGGHARFVADGYVRPDYRGRGIGTALARWGEGRARVQLRLAPAGVRVTLDQTTAGTDAAAADLFAREGYARVRTFWDMLIGMDAPPPAPVWPQGIAVRAFVLGEDEYAAYTAAEEAFQDHWGYVSSPFKEWRASLIDRADFDPSLVFLAWDGDEVAGAIRCRSRLGAGGEVESGWVDSLSVRRPWRGRGLGMALLLQAFGAFYGRGVRDVWLRVDAENTTGATRLYERAGMRVVRRFDVYRKTLREGEDLA